MMHRHQVCNEVCRIHEIESLAMSNAQFVCDGIQRFLAMCRLVGTPRKVLPNQAVNVLVISELPGTMRATKKVVGGASLMGDLGMPGHFSPLILGHAFARRQEHPIHRRAEACYHRDRRCVMHSDSHRVATGTLNRGTDRRGVALALVQVAFSMSRHQTLLSLLWVHIHSNDVTKLIASTHTNPTWSSCALSLTKEDNYFLALFTERQSVNLVRFVLAAEIGIYETRNAHAARFASNLLGRKALRQQVNDHLERFGIRLKLAARAIGKPSFLGSAFNKMRNLCALKDSVTAQPSTDHGETYPQQVGNLTLAHAALMTFLNGDALFSTQFFIRHGDNHTRRFWCFTGFLLPSFVFQYWESLKMRFEACASTH